MLISLKLKSVFKKIYKLPPIESAIILICLIGILIITPLTGYRIHKDQFIHAAIDALVVFSLSFCIILTYKQKALAVIKAVISLMLLASSVAVVAISGVTAIGWYYPGITIVFFLLPLNIALAFVIVSTIFLTVVTASMVEVDVWLPLIASIGLCGLSTYFIFSCYRKVEIELRKQVDKDYLTQVGNRSTFDRDIKQAADLSTRKTDLTVLVMLDLDNFKAVNDTFGHLSGDAVLTQTAKCLANSIRKDDSVYRYGGEEFAILFRNTNLKDALSVAEKIRSNVESTIFPVNRTITVSLGLGLYESGESLDNWIRRVDLALYKAKNTGKNKAVLADPTNYHRIQSVCNN